MSEDPLGDRLSGLLARLEWAEDPNGRRYCRICGGSERDHRDGCELAAALADPADSA